MTLIRYTYPGDALCGVVADVHPVTAHVLVVERRRAELVIEDDEPELDDELDEPEL